MSSAEEQFLTSRSDRNAVLQEARERRRVQGNEGEDDHSRTRDEFWSSFRSNVDAIKSQLEPIRQEDFVTSSQRHGTWNKIWDQFLELEGNYLDESKALPPGDVRILKEDLQNLNELMVDIRDNIICPRRSFVFRRYHSLKKLEERKMNNRKRVKDASNDNSNESFEVKKEDTQDNADSNTILENKTNENVILENDCTDVNRCLKMKKMTGCYVTLKQGFNSVNINNLIDCTIQILTPITSSLHITDCRNSSIIAAARQFRIHDSSNVQFHIHAQSGPIIENSRDIIFWGDFESLAGIKIEGSNQYRNVKDFNWLGVVIKSPNYKVVENDENGEGDSCCELTECVTPKESPNESDSDDEL
mmetsp:Transcript_14286/g.18019  ORF Transcript_14286/g.18019 Transcript_14286/m.18019 type:complete len:360 (+) Transcript_14286:100-1179(+)|eukprot:CAMPEP_0172496946 /NCGR_PEP_ID=MMETSP1066-20121228/94706_1 /TAXON_ID=671091 /ORGANISM="Coscinodiscus wailesii, Strain CCMP2513" /LENGTH=359 /DNA_ID=CAMNT_0013269503 /DNA_START=97 /DNA_END=1176 /DNA_ORIENTATION=+